MFRRLIVILSAAVACLLPASESVSATAAIAGDADTYDVTIGQRADVPARALDLDSAFARGAREGVASTTTVDAAPFTYDVPTISRVGDREFDDASASAARLRDVREGSASLSVEARGTSTTPSAQGVATNLADDGAQLALGSGRFSNANFATGQLEAHFAKHADEWGAIGQDAYLARARSMLGSDPGGNLVGFVRSNGDVLRYNVRTNEFAVGSSSGVIRTLFRPDDGIDYWLKQVAAG